MHGGKDSDTITGGTGSDFVSGDTGSDRITGADSAAENAGMGEIDTLTGGAGADTFALGDAGNCYYVDGDGGSAGLSDYALIADFNAGEDVIELHGSAAEYQLAISPEGLPAGTGIFLKGAGEGELVAIVGGGESLSLAGGYFAFV